MEAVELALLFAGLCGIIAATYRFNTQEATRLQHHESIVGVAEIFSRAPWYRKVRGAVLLLEKLADRVFGKPVGHRFKMKSYLQSRAWKVSAVLVAIYTLFLPAGYFFGRFGFYLLTDAARAAFSPTNPYVMHLMSGLSFTLLLVVFFFIFLVIRQTRRNSNSDAQTRNSVFLLPTLIIAVISVFFGSLSIFMLIPTPENTYSLLKIVSVIYTVFVVSILILVPVFIFMWIVASIWRFGFSSAIWIIVFTYLAVRLTIALITVAAVVPPSSADASSGAIALWQSHPIMSGLAAVIYTLFVGFCGVLGWKLFKQLSRKNKIQFDRRFYLRVWLVFAAFVVFSYIFTAFTVEITTTFQNDITLRPSLLNEVLVLLVLSQILILVLTPIYSNSLPDYFSVAFTRFCVSKALRSKKLNEVAKLILWDLLVALGCLMASLTIVVLGALFVSLLSDLGTYLVGQDNADYFVFVKALSHVILDVFIDKLRFIGVHTAHPLLEAQWADFGGIEAYRETSVSRTLSLVFMLFITTSLAPSIINAITMISVITSHFLAKFSSQAALRIHALLLEVDGHGNPIGVWRSTSIIGVCGGFSLLLALLFFDFLGVLP